MGYRISDLCRPTSARARFVNSSTIVLPTSRNWTGSPVINLYVFSPDGAHSRSGEDIYSIVVNMSHS